MAHFLFQGRSWVPSYDEWSKLLNLSKPRVVSRGGNFGEDVPDNAQVVLPVTDCWPMENKNQEFPPERELIFRKLFKRGFNSPFVYGMLFHSLFVFSEGIRSLVPTAFHRGAPTVMDASIDLGIHSRHTEEIDDGCNVTREISCVRELLSQHEMNGGNVTKLEGRSCHIYIMSDRECTLDSLQSSKELKTHGCSIHIPPHNKESSFTLEHGPFAGANFFVDLLYLSEHVHHGFVAGVRNRRGDLRSSSALARELIEFNSIMSELQQRQQLSQISGTSATGSIDKGTGAVQDHQQLATSSISGLKMCTYFEKKKRIKT